MSPQFQEQMAKHADRFLTGCSWACTHIPHVPGITDGSTSWQMQKDELYVFYLLSSIVKTKVHLIRKKLVLNSGMVSSPLTPDVFAYLQ